MHKLNVQKKRGANMNMRARNSLRMENFAFSALLVTSRNVTVLMYHLVFPAKYGRVVFDEQVDAILKEVCRGVAERYQVKFLEIATDKDHVHFLVQSVNII